MNTHRNFLFILADDLGWRDLSGEGSTYYESPNIDSIASRGTRFSRGYATCQVCSPSRASILTGKYTPNHGVTDWIGAPSGTDWKRLERHTRLLPPEYSHELSSDEITLADAFKRGGYKTFFAGKWHLGGEGSYPEDHGFDINVAGWERGSPTGGYFAPYANPKLLDGPSGESLPIRLGRETAEFIADNRDDPFFAYLSFYSVHGPIQTSLDRWEKYRQKSLSEGVKDSRFLFDRYLPVRQEQDCPIYGGMIEAMDDAVGIVLDTLDRLGLAENTVVCFTSDNGGVSSGDSFPTSNLPLRGGKGRQWEGGIREPYLIHVPGVTAPGNVCDVPVSGIDFYPTLLDLAGLPVPDSQQVDGASITPLLRGEADEHLVNRDLLWHYPHYGNQGGEPSSIIRSGDYKFIHYYEGVPGRNEDELYDLSTDPGEQHDLLAGTPATTNEELARNLRRRLETWLEETDAKLPVADPEHDADAEVTRLAHLQGEFMTGLERQHLDYLDPDWKPNEDWWGSMVTED
jgi:arylsulfatase A-like enzyme